MKSGPDVPVRERMKSISEREVLIGLVKLQVIHKTAYRHSLHCGISV